MNFQTLSVCGQQRLRVDNFLPKIGRSAMIQKALHGLRADNKHISSMFFYDAEGSKLFEAITRLPEYYLTRTEMSLLRQAARDIGPHLSDVEIVELGSGDCSKISAFLEGLPDFVSSSARYMPIDVSQTAIEQSAGHLLKQFPGLTIRGIVADFTTQIDLIGDGDKRLFCLFGSTIGNFSRSEAAGLLVRLEAVMQPGDGLLLGVDRVKDRRMLENAYNDSQEVTASFNRNILKVVNALAGTDFDPQAFSHVAFYNETESRIEMHLKVDKAMTITCPHFENPLAIGQEESIHTENSHKFTDAHIDELAAQSNLTIQNVLTDSNQWFSLVQLTK